MRQRAGTNLVKHGKWPRQVAVALTILLAPAFTRYAESQVPIADLKDIRPLFEDFIDARGQGSTYGQYSQRASHTSPDYYASLAVAFTRTIMGEDLLTSISQQQRDEWITHLQSFANFDGTYSSTHGHTQLHANGMTIGGLGALGGKQLYPATPLYAPFDTPPEATNYLENVIQWPNQWGQSHLFWGGLHMYSGSSVATPEWRDTVFNWLDSNIDQNSGWFRNPNNNTEGLGGGAHIWPMYEHFGHDFPEPEKVIDTILSMQQASGRFHSSSTYQDLDALYGLRYMGDLAPTYRTADIDRAAEDFGIWLTGSIGGFLSSDVDMHLALGKAGAFGLLHQLRPDLFPDTTGAVWTGLFTDPRFQHTAAVETFTNPDLTPVGADQPSHYSATVLADNPLGYWRLGQTGGIAAADASGNELTGFYNSLGTGTGAGNFAQPGLRPTDGFAGLANDNRAIHLNGFSSHVNIADREELDLTSALTLEAWIKLDQVPTGNAGIISKYLGSGNQRGYLLYVDGQNGDGELGMIISPDGTFSSASTVVDDVPLPTGEWLHVAGVFEADDFMRLYVNGELVLEETSGIPGQAFSNSADLWLGRTFSADPITHFPGLIDEVALYARALTDVEILAHYEAAFFELAGDFNVDGVVDAADYTTWLGNLGSNSPLPNDVGLGNPIGLGHYQLWKNNFGATSVSSASTPVPESATAVLFLALILSLCPRRLRCFDWDNGARSTGTSLIGANR